MAEAIKAFEGGLVVISHDFRLLQQVAQEIWVINKGIHKVRTRARAAARAARRSARANLLFRPPP